MDENQIAQKWNELFFAVRRSVRYHTHRRKFFDKLSVWSDFLIIVSGGTVVGIASSGVSDHKIMTIIFGALVAVIGSFDLVIGFSNKARDYNDLAREFSELERQMVTAKPSRTENDLIKFTNRRLEIQENEPPVLQVLDCYCHNELVKALGLSPAQKVRITFWQSLLKQFCDLHPTTLEKIGEQLPKQQIIMRPKSSVLHP